MNKKLFVTILFLSLSKLNLVTASKQTCIYCQFYNSTASKINDKCSDINCLSSTGASQLKNSNKCVIACHGKTDICYSQVSTSNKDNSIVNFMNRGCISREYAEREFGWKSAGNSETQLDQKYQIKNNGFYQRNPEEDTQSSTIIFCENNECNYADLLLNSNFNSFSIYLTLSLIFSLVFL